MLEIFARRGGRRSAWARGLAALAGTALTLGAAAGVAAAAGVYPYPANAVPTGTHVKTATCGYPRYTCKPSVLGKTSRVEPAPQRLGRFVEVSLAPWIQAYGADAVAMQPAKPLSGTAVLPKIVPYGGSHGVGFGTNTYPGAFFPSTGTWNVNIQGLQIPFLIPDWGVGVRSAVPMSANMTIPVPHGHYVVAWLLGTGIYGTQAAVVTEHYSNGSSQQIPVSFPDWCAETALPPEYPAVVTPYRLHPNGAVGTSGCAAFYAEYVPTNTGQTLTSISFPNTTPDLFVMSMSLETVSGPAPAPVTPPHVTPPPAAKG